MPDGPQQLNFFADMGPLTQLKVSLETLRDMVPDFDNNKDSFEDWRQRVKARMIEKGIDLETLKRAAPKGEIKGIQIAENGTLILHIDTPDNYTISKDNEPLAAYAFLCTWILSEEPQLDTEKTLVGLPPELLSKKFFPMLNGPVINDIMKMSLDKMEKDRHANIATYVTQDGRKLKVEKLDEVLGSLSVSAQKIFAHSLLYLKETNYYRGHPKSVVPTIEIPLEEYGRLTGRQITPVKMDTPEAQAKENARADNCMKQFKASIRRDLHDLSSLVFSMEETKGKSRGNYIDQRIISSHSIRRGNILRINFDIDAAAYFLNSYLMQYPKVLYLYDERKPNAFSIAYKIALHNSMDNNFARGTNNTLSVSSLLDAAPDIPTYEYLKSKDNRNWKAKIKGVLEKALDESITMGYLQKWEYRDPKTNTTYTPDQAKQLTYLKWHGLMVDFIVIDAPDQTQRREARAEAKRLATEKAGEPIKKKRGRPRKNPEILEKG